MGRCLSSLILALVSVTATATAQVASRGPLFISGKDQCGFDVFMVKCRHQRCIGPRGQKLGTRDDVLPYLPYIPARAIDVHKLKCWKFCFDHEGNLIGKPSPDYHNPYQAR